MIYPETPVKASSAARPTMRSSHDSHRIRRPIVKAPIWDGHSNGVLHAVRNVLARPGWRPALVMITSGFVGLLPAAVGWADPPDFHHAPLSAASLENPFRGQASAAQAGGDLYTAHCAVCHGRSAEGTGNIPALAHGRVQTVPDGEVFWFITKGSTSGAMPAWAALPEQQRWQLVTYLKTLVSTPIVAPAPVAAPMTSITAPPPPAPFTDFRFEVPGTVHKIAVSDLPAPFVTSSAGNAPTIVARPMDFHQRRILSTANSAVSWSTPTFTQPVLRPIS